MLQQIEQNLEKLTSIAISEIPSLLEVRVFGSYQNGKWNPEKSDIDIFMLLADESYSWRRNRRIKHFYDYWTTKESLQRGNLRNELKEKLENNEFWQRLSLHIATLTDMDRSIGSDEGKGDVGRNIYKGRELYRTKPVESIQALKRTWHSFRVHSGI
ncbi:hypothetical protein GOV04_00820 [Candidatus Woesearchaeota archaeon]|nr:hypothetical protein [Candidatus Woesearchaeota archaeon]